MIPHSREVLVSVNGDLRITAKRALQVGHFSIARGEHWCVFGGNGSGKTLLASWLRGEHLAGRESLTWHHGFSPARIAVVSFEEQQRLWESDNRHDISEFSESAMDAGTTVLELVTGCATFDDAIAALAADDFSANLLIELELTPLLKQGIRYLSSGQMRKALIGRALARRPALLILDDPLESIDRQSRLAIEHVLRVWRNGENSSMVLSRRISDILPGMTHLALMHDLRMIMSGGYDEMRGSAGFRQIAERQPTIPQSLPGSGRGLMPLFEKTRHSAPLIELRDVSAAYGDREVLRDINWTMLKGDHVLIEGPNGSGKSTLLSMINGDNHKAYKQHVFLFGRRRGSGETVWEIKSHFGTVSNELHNRYIKGWRVLDVVVSGLFDSVGLYDDVGASHVHAAEQWLQALDIGDLAEHWYHQISFGQQRLVLLARAMVKGPDVLILDEPCVGLDDFHKQMVLKTLDVIARQTPTQLIYVTHAKDEHPACINTFLCFEPVDDEDIRSPGEVQLGGEDSVSIRSRNPHTVVIRKAPLFPSTEDCDMQ